jgi:hypothetical protein
MKVKTGSKVIELMTKSQVDFMIKVALLDLSSKFNKEIDKLREKVIELEKRLIKDYTK